MGEDLQLASHTDQKCLTKSAWRFSARFSSRRINSLSLISSSRILYSWSRIAWRSACASWAETIASFDLVLTSASAITVSENVDFSVLLLTLTVDTFSAEKQTFFPVGRVLGGAFRVLVAGVPATGRNIVGLNLKGTLETKINFCSRNSMK